jgi:glutaminyl-tRNA synthetase
MSKKRDFIRDIIARDLADGKHETIVTRFPPEPNGYLHLGHARSICLNFGIAQENGDVGARCHLRFDDTNPAKEEAEYVESIKADVAWLGFDWGGHLYFASNYFDFFHDCALHLIREGKAYVDEQSLEEMRANRGSVTEAGKTSPYRERSVEENLSRFAEMREGKVADGAAVLRAKIDMAAPNMNMRDPVLYRVLHAAHHNTGDAWKIYPMYDFAHSLEDAKEHITHSLCTLEFEDHRPLYDWVVANCPVPATPRQIEFSRLNFTYTVMSKRKLLELVKEGIVDGWDDPRLPTICGARRLGIPAQAIRTVCEMTGITKQVGVTDIALLEFETRKLLNEDAQRRMAVLDPIKVILTNYDAGSSELVKAPNNPNDPDAGEREVALGREVWIEREDFEIDPPKKYHRLKPGGAVRLRGGYIIQYLSHEVDEAGSVTEVHCKYLPGTIGQNPPEGVKCKAAIHWVSVAHGQDAEVRIYDRLFKVENPDAAEGGFKSELNPDSLQIVSAAKVEPSLADLMPGERCQFERVGYFVADSEEHRTGEKLVFNRIVALRDSWGGGK